MELKDIARGVPAEIWTVFEPILPPVVWCGNGRPPKGNRECFHALLYVLASGIPWEMLPSSFPSYKAVQRRLKRWLERDAFRTAWRRLARRYEQLHGINWDQVLLDGSKKPSKKGGEQTGPSPVDRGKCGTALHLACDNRAMPLGVVITGANAADGCQAQDVLEALVIHPPQPECPPAEVDPRSLPTARADGAYGNKPTRQRAQAAGFRMRAPGRGQKQPGLGTIRQSVERCHNFLAQFGRIARRWDRSARRFLGWVQLAACIIFIRSGFVR
jgi:putative transposase